VKSICVYCGSASGKGEVYLAAARKLAKELCSRGLDLVYGGASIGLMAETANTVMANGGSATGVMPRNLFRREVPHEALTQMIYVDSMHERKSKMADLSDGFIAMPGGLGTVEELFEIVTWAQLAIHRKPCGILNVDGYYDHLIQFLDRATEQEFIRPVHRSMIIIEEDPARLLDRFEVYTPPDKQKWVDLDN
jgi:uncharacterized protein (TIGR00730 family)